MQENIYIIDMINGFCKEGALSDKRILKITSNIDELIKQKKDASIYVVEDGHQDNSTEFKNFPKHCLLGTSESETIDELQYVFALDNFKKKVKKNSVNAFYALFDEIKKMSDTKHYIVGCCTDICIINFALSLKTYFNEQNIDNEVIVLKDCTETYDSDGHEADKYNKDAYLIMETSGIKIMCLKDLY